jgi:hypothetical protein
MINEATTYPIILLITIGLMVLCVVGGWRTQRLWLRVPLWGWSIVLGGLVIYFSWYLFRPTPTPIERELYPGIRYERQILPGPIITHTVWVALDTPGLAFLVTPEDAIAGGEYAARTVSQFLEQHDLQVAINGDFFEPWRDIGFWDYYPHLGDPVRVQGVSAAQGDSYTNGYAPPSGKATVYISEDNRVSFSRPIDEVYNAISGNMMLIADGAAFVVTERDNDYLSHRHPRTAVGLNEAEDTLILVVVDGRQPNYSIGMTIAELITHMESAGAYHAVNLDGGGSATLVTADGNGNTIVMNSPIHNRIPGRERPVANHFGLRIVTNGGTE